MNTTNYYKLIVCLLAAIILAGCTEKKSTYLLGGSGWNQIEKVDANGKSLWIHTLEDGQECNSVTSLSNNKILYSFKKGAKIIDENHQLVWQYNCAEGAEVHSASLTKQGNILIGECGHPAKIYEFSLGGEKLLEINFETGVENPHSQFRRVRKTENDTYLVPVLGKNSIFEIDQKGQLIHETQFDFSVFSILLLDNGNWLLSCGDAHKLVEFNPGTEQIVWELNDNDIKDFSLLFVAEAIRIDNGNTIVCNWGGHSHQDGPKVQVFEIDQDKNLIWKFDDNQNLGYVSTIDPDIHQEYVR